MKKHGIPEKRSNFFPEGRKECASIPDLCFLRRRNCQQAEKLARSYGIIRNISHYLYIMLYIMGNNPIKFYETDTIFGLLFKQNSVIIVKLDMRRSERLP